MARKGYFPSRAYNKSNPPEHFPTISSGFNWNAKTYTKSNPRNPFNNKDFFGNDKNAAKKVGKVNVVHFSSSLTWKKMYWLVLTEIPRPIREVTPGMHFDNWCVCNCSTRITVIRMRLRLLARQTLIYCVFPCEWGEKIQFFFTKSFSIRITEKPPATFLVCFAILIC